PQYTVKVPNGAETSGGGWLASEQTGPPLRQPCAGSASGDWRKPVRSRGSIGSKPGEALLRVGAHVRVGQRCLTLLVAAAAARFLALLAAAAGALALLTAAMAGFAALAARFGCALPVVGKVAAAGLSALAARFRGAFRVIGEVAAAGLTTLAARFGCQLGVLREAALLRGYALTALAGDFTLLVFVHGSEAAIGRATIFILGHL